MRKVLDGSRIDRGRKKRRNIKKQVVRNPATLAQTMRRRILLTGAGELSTTGPDGGVTGRAAAAGTAVLGGCGGAAGGVPAGVSIVWLVPPVPCSWMFGLSTNAKPPSLRKRNQGRQLKLPAAGTRLLLKQSKLYNSPQCRELSLRSGSNYPVT